VHHLWSLLVALVVFVVVPSTGSAQASSSHDREAHALFEAATTAFDDGRFEDAHGYFVRAHALSGRPELLFNLASTAERLRRDAEALDYYRRYLAAIPDAYNLRFVEGRISFLERSLAPSTDATSDASASAVTTGDDASASATPVVVRPAIDSPTAATQASRPIVAETVDDTTESREDTAPPVGGARTTRRSHRTRNVILGVVAGVVAAGLGVGLGVGLRDPGYEPYTVGEVGAGGLVFTLVGR